MSAPLPRSADRVSDTGSCLQLARSRCWCGRKAISGRLCLEPRVTGHLVDHDMLDMRPQGSADIAAIAEMDERIVTIVRTS